MRWIVGGLGLLVVAAPLAFAWLVSGFLVDRPPDMEFPVPPGSDPRSLFGLEFSDVRFATTDGVEVGGWLVPAGESRSAVIFVHGRGGSRLFVLGILRALHAAGLAVLAIDARGHGVTPEPTPGAAFVTGWLDVAAAARFLREQRGYERIGLFGASQGAASVLVAAGRSRGYDAVLAQSGATSLFGLLRGMPALGWLPDWEIDLICRVALRRMRAPKELAGSPRSGPIDVIADIAPTPLFLLHGAEDELVTVAEAHRLHEAAREPKQLWIIEGRGHVDPGEHPDYERKVASFLREHLAP